jgi:hypothetical protein
MNMKIVLGVMLALAGTTARAAWEDWGGTRNFDQYIDRATIRSSGELVKMWTMLDFKAIQTTAGDSYLSEKTLSEYDCKEDRKRSLAFYWYGGQMGAGGVVYSNENVGKWRPVVPGSVAESTWKVACGK